MKRFVALLNVSVLLVMCLAFSPGCVGSAGGTAPAQTVNLGNVIANTTNALEQALAAYNTLLPLYQQLRPIVEQYKQTTSANCQTCVTEAAAAGCGTCSDKAARAVAPAGRAAAVICGLTKVDPAKYSGWSGACPGCDVDAQTFALACQADGVPYELLLNEKATYMGIVASARRAAGALQAGDLLILYISGHGGQQSDASDASEVDGKSETLCLYDGPLTDNLVWMWLQELKKKDIRVWMISDTCHSGTNYRSPHNYSAALRSRSGADDPVLLHWGGCADGKSSFGSAQGGTFTTALVDAYKQGQSYAAWFEGASRRMPLTQRPTCEWTGVDFRALPAFR